MTDLVRPGETPAGTIGAGLLPANYDLAIYRGDYFPVKVSIKKTDGVTPQDLTGYAAEASIRPAYDSTIHYDFTADIDPLNGIILLELDGSISQTMPIGSYIWDFEVTDPLGHNRTYLTGDVTLYGDVTEI